ncbi:tetratricopeptide repeat protein [Albibacillus kandeliae]|uniref:tetratricopeptide repeat protein n=1 Tax=Albibacillus kandeliae TaxID=2174228 RepID=UPI0018E5261D|nr:tetratricopeptide repeat protein [Albibacillus kandeliae]
MARERISLVFVLVLLLSFLALAACDSSEERAEEHFKSGLELIDKGDIERATIELRNALKLNNEHVPARLAFARILRDGGNDRTAYSQYLTVAEQEPQNFEAQIALSEMALENYDMAELKKHSEQALEIEPANLEAMSLNNTQQYLSAMDAKDDAAMQAGVVKARELLEQDSSLVSARKVLIDDLVRKQQWEEALSQLQKAIEASPKEYELYRFRLSVLDRLGDTDNLRAELENTVSVFPENPEIKQALLSFYVKHNDLDAAEAFLRKEAESDDPAKTSQLISFVLQFRGPEAATAELERVLSDGRLPPMMFKAQLAQLKYRGGDLAGAIADMQAVVDENQPAEGEAASPELNNVKVDLARMYAQQGNMVEARRLVENVLSVDSANPEASKLKANWLIQDDKTDDAIVLLRDALSNSPEDASLMTLMASAYERQGNKELMAEMLSQAMEASRDAPTETLRYARYLMAEEQMLPAESVLIESLRANPDNLELLAMLGGLYIKMENWAQAKGVITRLNELGTDQATNAALSLQAQSLAGQNRNEDLVAMLQGVEGNPGTKKAANIAIFRTRASTDGPEGALNFVEDLLKDAPGDPDYTYLKAGALVALQRPDEAEAIYRDLVTQNPQKPRLWATLHRLYLLKGDTEKASETLREAMEANPDSAELKLSMAQEVERSGDIEAAIKLYEELYETHSNSVVVANNLASLLADNRQDEASLAKAYAVARRLRGTETPALQDTYGWIAFRQGNVEEALPYLKAASDALANDPTVQYHYAKALAAAGRTEDALEQFKKSAAMLDESGSIPAYQQDLDDEIARLSKPADQ